MYARDSRDADLLYRSYRTLVLREPGDESPAPSLERDVEHEGLLLLLARRAGCAVPSSRALVAAGRFGRARDGGCRRPAARLAPAEELDAELLDAVWPEVQALHAAGIAHRALRAANILVTDDGRSIVDFGSGEAPRRPPLQAIDRAELLASLASLAGAEPRPSLPPHACSTPTTSPQRAVPAAARPDGSDAQAGVEVDC